MKIPSVRYADDITDDWEIARIDGRWVKARPHSYERILFFWRLQCAWEVFTGKSDVLRWKGNQ